MNVVGQFPHQIREIENEWITLVDGCRLAARIWMPEDAPANPVPAILEYLPYRKRDGTAVRDALTHPYFAGNGYACIRVDMRGSGESDGLMWDEYLAQEQDDALEVIDWLVAQPWCDGNVGMIGISWGGFNGLQVAYRQPSALKAVVTLCSTDDRYADDIHYKGGCMLLENFGWSSTMFAYSSRPPDPALVGEKWREMWLERLRNEPLLICDWLKHPTRDDYWKHGSICEDPGRVEAAVLAVGGWGDAYSNAVPRMLGRLTAPRRGIVGPWLHKYPHFAVPGPRIGFLKEALRWWDQWLKGIETGIMDEPLYRAYLQEGVAPAPFYEWRPGRWVSEEYWPTPRIHSRVMYLNQGGLGEQSGAGVEMVIASPATVGTAGGEYCAIWLGSEAPTDQRWDDGGSLCFDSPPLDRPVEILGAAELTVEFKSDRPLANLAVRLCDVAPGGASTRVTYGVLNLAHRNGHEDPETLEPGHWYIAKVKLDDVGYVFAPGQRIRLALSTAYWPLIWPAPAPVTLTVRAGTSRMTLPERPPRRDDNPSFEAAETAPPLAWEELRAPTNRRTVSTDVATGATTVEIHDDFGKSRNPEHGLITASIARERHTIRADDPLSCAVSSHWTEEQERGTWRARTETHAHMTADADWFYVTGRLEAYENDEMIFERDYEERVTRRFL